jgi:hypothetical protein
MNIEIADIKYWKKLNYYDGLLYCQLLSIDGVDDWRMLKREDNWALVTELVFMVKWFYNTDLAEHLKYRNIYWVVPVRDI